MEITIISTDEAVEAIKRGDHADAAKYRTPEQDELTIGALLRGFITAGRRSDGRIVFTRTPLNDEAIRKASG